MGYRKVGCLEQCWYIIRYWVREKIKTNWRNRT